MFFLPYGEIKLIKRWYCLFSQIPSNSLKTLFLGEQLVLWQELENRSQKNVGSVETFTVNVLETIILASNGVSIA